MKHWNETWIPHITYVKNKVSKGIGIMFKARNYLKRNALVNLYYSFIYPYLIYCIEAWGNAINCYLKQLYVIQKKVIRMIVFANYNTPSIDILKNLNILPLYKLVVDRIGIMVYKYANDLLPPALHYLYTSNSDFIITQQDRGTSFMSIRVTLILTQTVLVTQVLAYGMLFSPK